MIIGSGIPSKIRQCGQIYKDSKTGLKYHQSKCPMGNDWNLIDVDASNDASSGPGTMPTGLGEEIFYEEFTLSYSEIVDSFSTPHLLTTISNTSGAAAAITVLKACSVFTGTKFTNSNVYFICYTPNSEFNYGIAYGYNFYMYDRPALESVLLNWQSKKKIVIDIGSDIVPANTTVDLYFKADASLTGGDITSQMKIYLAYVLN